MKNWAHPTNNHKPPRKNNLWITTKWNHRNNIGIYPIWDYINHGTTIQYINKSNIKQ